MNILFLHANGIIPTAGGISRTTANLGKLFRKHGHLVWYLGVVDLDPLSNYDEYQLFLPTIPANSRMNCDYLCRFIISKDIRVIINQAPFASSIVDLIYQCSNQTKVKVISCYHNSILTPVIRFAYSHEYLLKKRHLGFVFHFLRWRPVKELLVKLYIAKWRNTFRHTIEKSDAIILLCEGQEEELLRMCGYKSCPKTYVIPNCVPSTEDKHLTKTNSVVWTGHFDFTIKRPDLMLRIWKRVASSHRDWTLYMLGDGSSLSSMKEYSKHLELNNVVFTGRVNPNDYYEFSRIQCVTSVHESFSLVSSEAMEKGNPVIAFNSFPAAPMVIKSGETGFLITPFDVDSFAFYLTQLMDNEKLCQKMGERAKESILTFSEESVFAMWNCLFEQL